MTDAGPTTSRAGTHRRISRLLRDLRTRMEVALDPELLQAALFHDCSKGPQTRLPHRVAWSLGERYGTPLIASEDPVGVVDGGAGDDDICVLTLRA